MIAIAKLFPSDANRFSANMTDAEFFTALERIVYQSHCRFAGMASDADLSAKYYRTDRSKLRGVARTATAILQEEITTFEQQKG